MTSYRRLAAVCPEHCSSTRYPCARHGRRPASAPLGPNCMLAHGPNEQRSRLINVPVRAEAAHEGQGACVRRPQQVQAASVRQVHTTACEYGGNCMYAHGEHELRGVEKNRQAEVMLRKLLETEKTALTEMTTTQLQDERFVLPAQHTL
eukprot:PhM_4_TR2391/c2_g3_i3/m.61251